MKTKKNKKAKAKKSVSKRDAKFLAKVFTSKTKPNPYAPLPTGSVTDASAIKVVSKRSRGSKYFGIFTKMNALKHGQAMTFPVPAGQNAHDVHNRFNSSISLYRHMLHAPKGHTFKRRVTADLKSVAVMCVRVGKAAANKAKKPAKKASKKAKAK